MAKTFYFEITIGGNSRCRATDDKAKFLYSSSKNDTIPSSYLSVNTQFSNKVIKVEITVSNTDGYYFYAKVENADDKYTFSELPKPIPFKDLNQNSTPNSRIKYTMV